jgi:hypothetical protein
VLPKTVLDNASSRVFKTAWFSKAARKAKISDKELCKAIAQVMAGQADDLGGGVYKKRLSNNQYRSIILARGGDYWVYEFLFAKQDMANISDDKLRKFRMVAGGYAGLDTHAVHMLLKDGDWIEICIANAENRI